MSIYHIMSDGTVRDSVAGHLVTNEAVYEIIASVNKRLKEEAAEKDHT